MPCWHIKLLFKLVFFSPHNYINNIGNKKKNFSMCGPPSRPKTTNIFNTLSSHLFLSFYFFILVTPIFFSFLLWLFRVHNFFFLPPRGCKTGSPTRSLFFLPLCQHKILSWANPSHFIIAAAVAVAAAAAAVAAAEGWNNFFCLLALISSTLFFSSYYNAHASGNSISRLVRKVIIIIIVLHNWELPRKGEINAALVSSRCGEGGGAEFGPPPLATRPDISFTLSVHVGHILKTHTYV